MTELFSSRWTYCKFIILFFCHVCTTWFRLSVFLTPLIKIRLLVYVSHLVIDSYRNKLWWILDFALYNQECLIVAALLITWLLSLTTWPTLTFQGVSLVVLKGHNVRSADLFQCLAFGTFRVLHPSTNSVFPCVLLQTEESIPLRVEGTLRTSLSSLGVSLRVHLTVHKGPGADALLSRCQIAKFWASTF